MTRDYFPGVGQAVADRTINRGAETWGDVARRVAVGNTSLVPGEDPTPLEEAIGDGRILLSGRHLQHGDENQKLRNMEVFTNCSTASQRALVFYLLLNGSGVGTSYDDDMCAVDWSRIPEIIPVHDNMPGFMTQAEAKAEMRHWQQPYVVFNVPDSREGWAEALQVVEDAAFSGDRRTLIIDHSGVRPKGSPIGGMQSRPASGPEPLMHALRDLNRLRGSRAPLWLQAMEVDHMFAEIVLVGGARRSARIAVKWWEDTDILDFINVKQNGGHWTANNSIGVDARFWSLVRFVKKHDHCPTSDHRKAWTVFKAATEAQYQHGTGEPGFLNMDLISKGETAPSVESATHFNGNFHLSPISLQLRAELTRRLAFKRYPVIVNPCGEIRLVANGAYCVIGDIAVAHCTAQEQFENDCRLTTRALIRTNTMPALYQGEVNRTNRIGVALTGIHEYAWNRFGLTFLDLVDESDDYWPVIDANGVSMPSPTKKAWPFWHSLQAAAHVVQEEAVAYSRALGVEPPVTSRTIKPAGTTSKLFGLTEGAHLPSMREYLRWVQFAHGDPLIDEYEAKGYPVIRQLQTYKNVSIVGFPTRLAITEMMGDKVVTAAEATPEQQIRWIRLLETFWLLADGGNQISYTLKYDPKVVGEEAYQDFIMDQVPLVRAVSVMPQIDTTAYEYQPEQPITPVEYDELMARIELMAEDIGREHVDCASGACPVDFRSTAAA